MKHPNQQLTLSFVALFLCQVGWPATEIRLHSQDGDRVGLGQDHVLTENNGALSFETNGQRKIGIRWFGETTNFSFDFMDTGGLQLTVGSYEVPEQDMVPPPGGATMDIFGNTEGCPQRSGAFEIYEVEYDANGIVTKLALDATQYCDTTASALEVQIRVNSDVSFDLGPRVQTVDDMTVAPGSQVVVGLTHAASTNGAIVSYSWIQEYGTPVVLAGANTDTISFASPLVDAEYEVMRFDVTVTDIAGDTASDHVTVVSSELPVRSRYLLQTTPGGFIGGNQSVELDIDTDYLVTSWQRDTVHIDYEPPTGIGWSMTIAAPDGDTLDLGQYDLAFRTPFRPSNKPGVEFGITGRGCNELLGDFNILDIGFAANHAVNRIAIDTNIECFETTGGKDPVEVRLRYNTAVPIFSRAPVAKPGQDQVAFAGDLVLLDARASHDDFGEIVQYEWTKVSGPPVEPFNPGSAVRAFIAPDVLPGQGLAEFDITVVNDAGFSDTERVAINILGSEDPKTFIKLSAPPKSGFGLSGTGQRLDRRLDDNAGSFFMNQDDGVTSISFDSLDHWRFRFAEDAFFPDIQNNLSPGLYEFATHFARGRPLINADSGESFCTNVSGRFVVHEFVEGADDTIESFAIDLEYTCDFNAPIVGNIRFRSTVPVDPDGLFASAGRGIDVIPGQLVDLDATDSYVGPSLGVDYQWQQLSGPPVIIINDTQPVATFEAPEDTGVAIFQVTITTAEGLIDTAEVSVNLLGSDQPVTAMYLFSGPGEPLGFGEPQYYDAAQVSERRYEPDLLTISNFALGSYLLAFSTANGETFAPGDYLNAFAFGRVAGFPGLDLRLGNRQCVAGAGWYRIYEIQASSDVREIDTLAVDFWQNCAEGLEPLYGTLRINSTVPLRTVDPVATAGQHLLARESTDVNLSAARSFSWYAPITTYSWTQLAGPPATIEGADTATPTISLPSVSAAAEDLLFEVQVTNGFGNSTRAQTVVTALNDDQPLSEFRIVAFDPNTNQELLSYHMDVNNSNLELDNRSTILDASVTDRVTSIHFSFELDESRQPFEPGIYHRYDNRDDATAPFMNIAAFPEFVCDRDDQTWLHILDSDANAMDETMSSLAFETGRLCDGVLGLRVSGRLNSTLSINPGEPVVIAGPDIEITEGQTVFLEDVVAYVEGEPSNFTGWEQLGGPPIKLASYPNARTRFVTPAVSGDTNVRLRLAVLSADFQLYTDELTVLVRENGISGFPADLVTTATPGGSYGAVPRSVAIDADDLVAWIARSPEEIAGGGEPASAPYGAFDFEFETNVGGTIRATIHFDEAVDAESRWLRQEVFGGWNIFAGFWTLAGNRRSLTFEIMDGETEDLDGRRNGKVLTSAGLGVPAAPPQPPPVPPPSSQSGSSGGGGSVSVYFLLIFLTRMRGAIAMSYRRGSAQFVNCARAAHCRVSQACLASRA